MKKILVCLLLLPFTAVLGQKNYFIQSRDHFKIFINEYGSGKPVILLAGGPGMTALYIEPIWKNIAGVRFIVPDQRGTGKSVLPKIDSTTISVAQYVDDLEALRVHLQLNKITIAGHSWGGMLAAAYAAKYPDHVERLVLISSGGITDKFAGYFADNIMMRLTQDEIKAGDRPDSNGMVAFRAITPGYFYDREKGLVARQAVTPADFGQESQTIQGLCLSDYSKTVKSRVANLKKYTGPVHLIQGRQDPVGESTAFETKSILKQAKIEFIERCGHLPWQEDDKVAKQFFALVAKALQ